MKKILSGYPELVSEWHPTKNGELKPEDFTHASNKKVWWLCPKGHSYESIINNRTRKKPTGCQKCKNLDSLFPSVSSEWHPTKNGDSKPEEFAGSSGKKVWWLCPKGHEYDSTISGRTRKGQSRGCPYCSGHKVGEDNNLKFLFQKIAKEWHPTKNGSSRPEEFSSCSHKKVWWLCPKGHSYDSSISGRTRKDVSRGCPYCSNQKVGEDNNLLFVFPRVADEWHPTKNEELKPEEFASRSGKKVWWLCPKGHSYYSEIQSRTGKNKSGCPYCSGNKVSDDNNLNHLFPKVASEWHPTKNGVLKPEDFTHGSGQKVWWLCPKGHEYDSMIAARTGINPTGCPYCSNQKVGEDNNLLSLFPKIADEWHPTKNGELKPDEVTYGSKKKVWWLCPKGHEYDSVIAPRTSKRQQGCPYCSKQSSSPELRILSEFRFIFDDVKTRHKIEGVEIDVYVPKLNLAIEYDGSHFHQGKEQKDLEKNKFLQKRNIEVFRVRCRPLTKITENDLIVENDHLSKSDLNRVFKNIYSFADSDGKEKINEYLDSDHFLNENLFRKYLSYLPSPLPENSLTTKFPNLVIEWDFDKNHPLIPDQFSEGSHNIVWWLCPKGHSYDVEIKSRTRKDRIPQGCPYCSNRRANDGNNLLSLFPKVADEWHPTKNGSSRPEEFTYGSKKKVWWLCPKGHSYDSVIHSRTRKKPTGCQKCKNLDSLFPSVSSEWHPTKNGDSKPEEFAGSSGKKVWWLCPKGHEYDSTISGRTRKGQSRGCPYCSGHKVGEDNNLKFLFQKIAKEWHPTKNGSSRPEEFSSCSHKKVWWLCPKGHDYDSRISHRTRKKPTGCPHCYRNIS